MRTNTKNRLAIITAAGAGAAAIAVAGFALPASADEPRGGDWSTFTTTLSAPIEAAQTWLTSAIEAGSASVSPEPSSVTGSCTSTRSSTSTSNPPCASSCSRTHPATTGPNRCSRTLATTRATLS